MRIIRFPNMVVRCILLAAVLMAMSPSPILAEVNLHNGYIRVDNATDMPAEILTVQMLFNQRHQYKIPPHSTVMLDNCCYAAGTEYYVFVDSVMTDSLTIRKHIVLKPRLCNERGIPHGYARIELTKFNPNNMRPNMFALAPTRIDSACP